MLKTVSEEVKQKRFEICKSCEFLWQKTNICSICKCFMPGKTAIAMASCPKGFWSKEEEGKSIINKIEEKIINTWNKQ